MLELLKNMLLNDIDQIEGRAATRELNTNLHPEFADFYGRYTREEYDMQIEEVLSDEEQSEIAESDVEDQDEPKG